MFVFILVKLNKSENIVDPRIPDFHKSNTKNPDTLIPNCCDICTSMYSNTRELKNRLLYLRVYLTIKTIAFVLRII